MRKIYFTIIALMASLAVSAQSTKEYVDLGLPSGTLWATCNIGANSPEEYGDYFAWGETEPKEDYYWTTYKWCNGWDTMTKYCVDSEKGVVDNNTELDPEDDAATVNWGSEWCMPTIGQLDELFFSNYTTVKWTTQNGVYGVKIYSKKNNQSLFFPAAGVRIGTRLDSDVIPDEGPGGYYRTRSLVAGGGNWNTSEFAYGIDFNANVSGYFVDRFFGGSVRPIRLKEKVTTSINSVTAGQKVTKNGKYISGGNLVIVKDGKKYNANGMEIK